GDENIADVKFVVIWQIDPVHPEDYAFHIANQRETVKAVAESAMREVIGRGQIQRILTADRPKIEADVQQLMQGVLNWYKAGILVLQVVPSLIPGSLMHSLSGTAAISTGVP